MTNCTYSIRSICLSVLLIVGIYPAFSQQIEKSLNVSNGDLLGFLEYKPAEYDQDLTTKYPIIIFLHGVGERGNGTSQLKNVSCCGLPRIIKLGHKMRFTWNGKTETFLVLSPQCPDKYWSWPTILVEELVGYAKKNLRIDTNRIYITGLSMGGGGTYRYISASQRNAGVFAAAATIAAPCMLTSGENVARANLPLWSFHAADDTIAPATCTESAIAKINAANPAVVPLKTIWPTGGHIVWDRVYTDTSYRYQGIVNIYEWFLAQNRTLPVNKLPVANAGPDLTVSMAVGIVALNASASTDSDGKLVRYVWKKIAGPAGPLITAPMSAGSSTAVSGLTTPGIYSYELAVVDDRAAFSKDTVNIKVVAESPLPFTDSTTRNLPPIANAGADRIIQLTWTDKAFLNGTLSRDPDGWIPSVTWIKVSGPATNGIIESPVSPKTFGLNLVAGTYKYRIIVADNKGALAYDDILITADSTGMAAYLKTLAPVVALKSSVEGEISYAPPVNASPENVYVYPNPGAGEVNLVYQSKASGRSLIRLFDVSGRIVKTAAFQKGDDTYRRIINLSGLDSGIYYVEVTTGSSRLRTKLVKK